VVLNVMQQQYSLAGCRMSDRTGSQAQLSTCCQQADIDSWLVVDVERQMPVSKCCNMPNLV
jgi:hypothetical protein